MNSTRVATFFTALLCLALLCCSAEEQREGGGQGQGVAEGESRQWTIKDLAAGAKRVGTALSIAAMIAGAAYVGGAGGIGRSATSAQVEWNNGNAVASYGGSGPSPDSNALANTGGMFRGQSTFQQEGTVQKRHQTVGHRANSVALNPLANMGVSQKDFDKAVAEFNSHDGKEYDFFKKAADQLAGGEAPKQGGKGKQREMPVHPKIAAAEKIVKKVNAKQSLWKAVVYPELAMIGAGIGMMGLRRDPAAEREHAEQPEEREPIELPAAFDSRTHWPHCRDIVGQIQNQGECGSCWAVSAASVISDRICIASGGRLKVEVSSREIAACARPNGCNGGLPYQAFALWQSQGLVSNTCQRYPSLWELKTGYELQCKTGCDKKVPANPRRQYGMDNKHITRGFLNFMRHRGLDEAIIQREIYENGPVVIALDVHEDFNTYRSGIYKHVEGKKEGGHAVRLIGWGEEQLAVESNGEGCWNAKDGECKHFPWAQKRTVKYWLVANSWGAGWGERGLVRIVRGVNQNGVENEFWFARPDLGRSGQ